MKRKWTIPIIILAVVILLVIVVWPMAPIWEKIGFEPFCIQQDGSKIKIVSCPEQGTTAVSPVSLPTPGPSGPIPIIVDDDGSPDGTIAMLYFLRNPLFDVRGVTISYGEAHPKIFVQHITQILGAFGRDDIPVGFGNDAPLEGTNTFPEPWREASNDFWGLSIPQAVSMTTPLPAAVLMADIIAQSEEPVTIFLSGSHTNLAEALRLDPGIAANIQDVFIMGGSAKVPGNIHSDWPELDNEVAEWNIWVDPLAAQEVFASGLPLHLVPLDATRQVVWTRKDIKTWRSASSPEGGFAGNILKWMLDNWSEKGIYVWDLVAAVQATTRSVCPEAAMEMEIITTPGPEQGQTRVIAGGFPVSVCLDPLPDQVKALAALVFSQP